MGIKKNIAAMMSSNKEPQVSIFIIYEINSHQNILI